MVQATIQNTGSISTESPRYRFRVKAWCWLFSFPRHCSSWIPAERRAACTYYIIKNITSYSCSYLFFSTVSFFCCRPLPCWCSILLLCLFHFHRITYTARDTQWGCLIACSRQNGNFIFFLSYLICLFRDIFFPVPFVSFTYSFFFFSFWWWKTILIYEYADGWTTEDLVFLWRAGDPVQVAPNMQLPRFALEKFKTDSCNSITNTG